MWGGPRPLLGRGRDYATYVSRLLKVVETQIWAQNDRNSRVYISTYNNPKLPDRFLVIWQKLKSPQTQHEKMQKIIYFNHNLQFKPFKIHFLCLFITV